MSAAKYTPGPWKADLCLDGWGIHEVHGASGLAIARLSQMQTAFAPDDKEGIANACLMAAAPDLLDAAAYALDVLNKARGKQARLRAIQRLQAAIAKATGGAA